MFECFSILDDVFFCVVRWLVSSSHIFFLLSVGRLAESRHVEPTNFIWILVQLLWQRQLVEANVFSMFSKAMKIERILGPKRFNFSKPIVNQVYPPPSFGSLKKTYHVSRVRSSACREHSCTARKHEGVNTTGILLKMCGTTGVLMKMCGRTGTGMRRSRDRDAHAMR